VLVVEQIIRPTGLLDPIVEVRPTKGQVDDLLSECKKRVAVGERVLVTTLTKRMAEELTDYLNKFGVSTRYLHSDIDTLERVAIIQALRAGEFNVLVGINLLREGLDIPEVSLVTILDADKEGFLRSTRSLIQTFGRAARNVEGRVILYADKITNSMHEAMGETSRRRERQEAHNLEHGIVPKTIHKEMDNVLDAIYAQGKSEKDAKTKGVSFIDEIMLQAQDAETVEKFVKRLERDMRAAAKDMAFERAAELRDAIVALRKKGGENA